MLTINFAGRNKLCICLCDFVFSTELLEMVCPLWSNAFLMVLCSSSIDYTQQNGIACFSYKQYMRYEYCDIPRRGKAREKIKNFILLYRWTQIHFWVLLFIHCFNSMNKHLQKEGTVTGAIVCSFWYQSASLLVSVVRHKERVLCLFIRLYAIRPQHISGIASTHAHMKAFTNAFIPAYCMQKHAIALINTSSFLLFVLTDVILSLQKNVTPSLPFPPTSFMTHRTDTWYLISSLSNIAMVKCDHGDSYDWWLNKEVKSKLDHHLNLNEICTAASGIKI